MRLNLRRERRIHSVTSAVQAATWIAFNPHLEETPMRRITLIALLLASPLVIADSDISKVNGSVRAEAGAKYDELSTVNGSITVGRGAHARTVETVNGGINVDDQAEIGSLETVNGGIDIGEAVIVSGSVSTVNGSIDIERGSRIEGQVETVNGRIQQMASEIGRGIETVNGDITVGADSIVRGGILVEEPSGSGWFNWGNKPKRTFALRVFIRAFGTSTSSWPRSGAWLRSARPTTRQKVRIFQDF
jgi:DUF4097 and DUF4098 domain-containing protein YvlB